MLNLSSKQSLRHLTQVSLTIILVVIGVLVIEFFSQIVGTIFIMAAIVLNIFPYSGDK